MSKKKLATKKHALHHKPKSKRVQPKPGIAQFKLLQNLSKPLTPKHAASFFGLPQALQGGGKSSGAAVSIGQPIIIPAIKMMGSLGKKTPTVFEALAQTAADLVVGAVQATVQPKGEKFVAFTPQAASSALFGLSAARLVERAAYRLGELRAGSAGSIKSMDPHLQMAVARARLGLPRVSVASASAREIPVVAKVKAVAEWEAISEVRIGAIIGQTEDGQHVVTARLPINRIEAVRAQPCVVSLKAAQSVRPVLAATIEETHARTDLLPSGTKPQGGKGVVVGIVDFGCDFAHRNFRHANGSTRLEAIWHQAAKGVSNSVYGYGRVHRQANIDAALKKANPYATLGYGPEPDTATEHGTHGTHVMDIAAGNGRGSGVSGCAPEAALIFVDLSSNDIPWTGSAAVGKSFGDSVQLLEALKFIFTEAGERPCVINLSLGTNGGPHDGTTLVEQGIDALLREKPNRAVIIAASNSHEDGIHAGGNVPAGGNSDLTWEQTRDFEPAEMEIWLPGEAKAAVELLAPDGTSVGIIEPGDSREFVDNNQILLFIANRLAEPNNKDNCIGIFIAGAFQAGTWKVRLHARGAADVPFHAWIERYDYAQSAFGKPHNNSYTLGSISCGNETIVVGSYDAHKTARTISWFSSAGPTRDGREKPEISGPGQDVSAAWSRTGSQVTLKSGTSMAAPAVAGIVALIYAQALHKGRNLTSADLRDLVIKYAKKTPPAGNGWHPRYGHGRISADLLPHV